MGGRRRRVCTEVDVENDGVLRGTWAARHRVGGASTRRPRRVRRARSCTGRRRALGRGPFRAGGRRPRGTWRPRPPPRPRHRRGGRLGERPGMPPAVRDGQGLPSVDCRVLTLSGAGAERPRRAAVVFGDPVGCGLGVGLAGPFWAPWKLSTAVALPLNGGVIGDVCSSVWRGDTARNGHPGTLRHRGPTAPLGGTPRETPRRSSGACRPHRVPRALAAAGKALPQPRPVSTQRVCPQ